MKYNRETQKYLNKVSTMDIAYIVGIAFEWFFNGLTVIEVGSAIVALASFVAIKKDLVDMKLPAIASLAISAIPLILVNISDSYDINTILGVVSIFLIIDSIGLLGKLKKEAKQ